MPTAPTTACDREPTDTADPPPPRLSEHGTPQLLHPRPRPANGGNCVAGLAAAVVVVVSVVGRLPQHLLHLTAIRGWAPALFAVMAMVNGARAIAQAPFTFARRRTTAARWAADQIQALGCTVVVGGLVTLPLYAFIRSSSHWWLWAWAMFAVVTVASQAALPLILGARAGSLVPAAAPLAERVRAICAQSGVDFKGDVLVAGNGTGKSPRCNAYVVGLGPSRRVILEAGVAAWPEELLDQVVAHEIGHWRLGHGARRLPLTLVAQLATLALAATVLSFPAVLRWAGVGSAGDPRSYPLLLALTALVVLPARLSLAWYDRAQERAADRFARIVLGTPEDFVAMLELAACASDVPRSLPWWRRAVASHPPIDERILACQP